MLKRLLLLLLLAALSPASLLARIISYSPYTDRTAVPAHQLRTNRYFVMVEATSSPFGAPIMSPVPSVGFVGELVVYDFLGQVEPRVVYPQEGAVSFLAVAVRENGAGVLSILAQTMRVNEPGSAFYLSTDSGATWRRLEIPTSTGPFGNLITQDIGGPFAAARGAQIRVGNDAWPFVVATRTGIHAVGADGATREIGGPTWVRTGTLLGRDSTGSRFLVLATNGELHFVNTEALSSTLVGLEPGQYVDGWLTANGAYVEERSSTTSLYFINSLGQRAQLLQAAPGSLNLFAVPTHDYSGAWIIQRGPGRPTVLYKHTPTEGLVKQWEDITAPEVEALHTGSSGTKLLVQVHRPRPQTDQRIFQDPALAVWKVGEPAPRFYDELYMDEQFNKGFVHLDVEKIEAGEPFVFDSGLRWLGGGGGISPSVPISGGGGDVVQEWGVVRASLKQRLVLPAVGRTPGAFGSYWLTDVILQNPATTAQRVDIRFAPSGASIVAAQDNIRTVTLAPKEIRLIEDVLFSLFGIESGLGAFFIEPELGITMTSRTYSKSATGTYGFGMHAMDVYAAAASARFPLTFAGAFLGQEYRTNLIITDAGESGSLAGVRATGVSGPMGFSDVAFEVGTRGQQQINNVASAIGLWPFETGALLFRPSRGSATAAVFAIDNRTNDPTYFPPDLPAPIVRTIPAIGHVNGANNSRFRSDLYLYNPANQTRTVTLQMKMWDSFETATINFTMLPNEARIIRDVLSTLFGRTGIARLRYMSVGDTSGVRVTSRTYSVDDNGGTYGFLMPPLNNFQSGGFGDTLEILGAVASNDYRTNIGLVDLAAFPMNQAVNVRVEIVDSTGRVADSFTANVPSAGGMQLNDVFRSRGIDVSGPVLIRVSPLNGLVGAYATFLDNRTNDAVYLSANLGAKE